MIYFTMAVIWVLGTVAIAAVRNYQLAVVAAVDRRR